MQRARLLPSVHTVHRERRLNAIMTMPTRAIAAPMTSQRSGRCPPPASPQDRTGHVHAAIGRIDAAGIRMK